MASPPTSEWFWRAREVALAHGETGQVSGIDDAPPWLHALACAHDAEALTRLDEGLGHLARAESTPAGGWSHVLELIKLRLAVRRGGPGALDAGLDGVRKLVASLDETTEQATSARAWYLAGIIQLRAHRFEAAEDMLTVALKHVEDAPMRNWILDAFAQTLAALGAFQEARRTYEALLVRKKRLGDPLGVAITVGHLSQLELGLRLADAAERHSREALVDTAGAVVPLIRLRLTTTLVNACLEQGALDRARTAGSELRRLFDAISDPHSFRCDAALALARLTRADGDGLECKRWLGVAEAVFATPDQLAAACYWRARFAESPAEAALALARAHELFRHATSVSEAEIDTWLLEAQSTLDRGDRGGSRTALERAYERVNASNNPVWLRRVDAYALANHPDLHHESALRRFTGGSAAELDETVRADASIVFADLVGFTPRSEQMSAEDVMDTVRCLFELSVPVLERYRVQPLSYRGDGLLACARGVGHEARALAFAREFTRRAARVTRVRHALGDEWGLDVRAGVSAGPVVLGVLGSLYKLEYVVNGRTANLAARLQSSARPNDVVCDARVAAAAKLPTTEELALKGIAGPVAVARIAVGVTDPS